MLKYSYFFYPSLKKEASFSSFLKNIIEKLGPEELINERLVKKLHPDIDEHIRLRVLRTRLSGPTHVPPDIKDDFSRLYSAYHHKLQHNAQGIYIDTKLYDKLIDKYRSKIKSKGYDPDLFDMTMKRGKDTDKDISGLEQKIRNYFADYLDKLHRGHRAKSLAGYGIAGGATGYLGYKKIKRDKGKKNNPKGIWGTKK